MFGELHENNNLAKYKRSTGRTWPDMAQKTGLSVQSLIRIAKLDGKGIEGKLILKTYLLIRDEIGVDLINNK